jgi:hypothetical protein
MIYKTGDRVRCILNPPNIKATIIGKAYKPGRIFIIKRVDPVVSNVVYDQRGDPTYIHFIELYSSLQQASDKIKKEIGI